MKMMLDSLRVKMNDVLASQAGNQYKPVRLLREVLGTANDLVGRPICSQAELDERRGVVQKSGPEAREAAPVMLYFDGKDHRTKKKMEEVLRAREVPFTVLDVTDDEATRSWALTAAKSAEFPLVFIAGEAVGGLHELTQLDVNGGLKKRVFG
jgi:glutaredoxin-related protein